MKTCLYCGKELIKREKERPARFNKRKFCSHKCYSANESINITGEKFGRLTAIKFHHRNKKDYYWEFKCDCGKEVITLRRSVTSGNTRSCGCLHCDIFKGRIVNFIDGRSKTLFYTKWCSILARCNNPHTSSYRLYGGRGIKCLWKSFEEFRDDMYESFINHVEKFGERRTSIERIDPNGNYCKENCTWTDIKKQARNTRFNKFITFNNQTKCVAEWAELFKIKPATLAHRIRVDWPIEKALTTPVK